MPTEFSSEEVSVYGVEKDSAYVDIDFPKEGVYISDSYAEKYRLAEGLPAAHQSHTGFLN